MHAQCLWIHSLCRSHFCLPHLPLGRTPCSWKCSCTMAVALFGAKGYKEESQVLFLCDSPCWASVSCSVGVSIGNLWERRWESGVSFILRTSTIRAAAMHNFPCSDFVIQPPEGMRGQMWLPTTHSAAPWKACWSLPGKANVCQDFSDFSKKQFLLQGCSKLPRETYLKLLTPAPSQQLCKMVVARFVRQTLFRRSLAIGLILLTSLLHVMGTKKSQDWPCGKRPTTPGQSCSW